MRLPSNYSIILFTGKDCAPCSSVKVLLKSLSIPHSDISVDNKQGAMLATFYQVRSKPTMIILDESGSVKRMHVGSITKYQLEKLFKEIDNAHV